MTAKQLKNSILKEAVQGKLVSQNKEDEPSSELLKRIKAERDKLIKAGKIKPNKNISSIYRKGNSFYEKRGKDEICIDAELPFEISKTWEWVRLIELIYLINGTSYQKSDISNNGIRIIRGGNIQENRLLIFDDDIFISKDYFDADKNIRKGDIIIVASTGSKAVIGKPAFINENYEDTQIGAFLRIIRSYSLEIVDYINIIFQSYYYRAHIRSKVKGTNINNIKSEYIENLLIPIPPIEEQKRIVNKLNELMPLIEEYEKLESELNELDKKFPERLKKSILKEAFDGKLIKSSNKWKELTFSKCINVIGIKHKIKRKYYLKNGKYPIIDQSYNFISGYSSNDNILINIKKPVIIFGDHTRCFKFIDFDFIAGADGIKILEPKEFFNEKLFYYFCLSLNIPNRGYSRHYKFLTKIKMRIPPIEEQKRIVEKLDKMMELCEELKK